MAEVKHEDDEELVIVEPGTEPEAQEDDAPANELDDDDDDADDFAAGWLRLGDRQPRTGPAYWLGRR